MNRLYTSGDYLANTGSWHMEDAGWKARRIAGILESNNVHADTIVEVGCGAGEILVQLSRLERYKDCRFVGYDISPQAISLCMAHGGGRIEYYCGSGLEEGSGDSVDVLLAIDVAEHVEDVYGFLSACKARANYKVYHIPLDIHVSSVVRASFVRNRYSIGHIHYFTKESALLALKDTGHEIVDSFFTNGAVELSSKELTLKRSIANIARKALGGISHELAARYLGGYSLMVLAV